MPNLRETRISLLYTYDSSIINDEEFVLLYDINTAKSSDFPYWNYEAFDPESMSGDECQAEFHFYKNDVYDLNPGYVSWRACTLRLCKLLSTVKILLFLTRDFLHARSEGMQITFNCKNFIVFNA